MRWLSHLGSIRLDIQLQDRTVSADVPPLEAAFIELFSERGMDPLPRNVYLSFLTLISSEVWTVNDLIERVGPIERPAALKALLAWVDRGVLREENDGADVQRFRLLESAHADAGAVPVMATAGSRVAVAEEQPTVLTVQQQQAEQMKVYWKVRFLGFWSCDMCRVDGWRQFIEGMLTNLGGLPLDRIQTMLKFAPGYDRTADQLGAFMDAARREGLVNVKDGIWRLNR